MYFIRNLEDQKLEVHFSKAEYQAMSEEKKKFIKSNCLFSGSRSCWRSRGKLAHAEWAMKKNLIEWGFEDRGQEGEKLSFAEQVEREQEKAAERAERMENRQDKAEQESTARYQAAHQMGSVIPFGQPILVGHHSERGHRSLLAKIDNNMRKSCEAQDKAEYYGNKLKNAEYTAEGKKFKNSSYLINRIRECKANIAQLGRHMEGKLYTYSKPQEIGEKARAHYQERINEETEKMEYMVYCLKQIQQETGEYNKENLKGKAEVFVGGKWRKIIKLNRTSVSVPNTIFQDEESQKKWANKYFYEQIKDAK